jgi:hypothetical protein
MENIEILEVLKGIDKKLGIIVGEIIKRGGTSVSEQVGGLVKLKMSNEEIADILGISPKDVAKERAVATFKSTRG